MVRAMGARVLRLDVRGAPGRGGWGARGCHILMRAAVFS